MTDNCTKEGASAGYDGGFLPVELGDAEGAGYSVAQVDPTAQNSVKALDRKISEDVGRDDTFVDCPDEIETSDSQQNTDEKDNQLDDQPNESNSGINVQKLVTEIENLRDMNDNAVAEKERLAQEYEEERAELVRELTNLCYQLKIPNEAQTMPGENVNGVVDHHAVAWDKITMGSGDSPHDIISECSRLLKIVLEDHKQAVEKSREFDSVLYSKDQEIHLLNAKVAELSESVSTSKKEQLSQWYEVQYSEEIVNRILAMFNMMHRQDDQLDGSLTEKISKIEYFVTVLAEKYNNFLSESYQLREAMNEVGLEFRLTDEIETFSLARDKILELGRKEQNLHHELSSLEDENRKLTEQLEKQRLAAENLNEEIERLHAEVEQEKNRYSNTKEKLSIAVTKGKALVQHRDSLKQLLAEKSSELEKCAIELQEKSAALEAAEKTKDLFEKAEQFSASLQQSLMEKDAIIKNCEEILSESVASEDLQQTDITGRIRWLADENKSLKAVAHQYHKLNDALSSLDFPETVASNELVARVQWLAQSFYLSNEEAARLQSEIKTTKDAASWEIDRLTTSLLSEMQERSYILAELEDLRNKYEACEKSQHELAEGRVALNNEVDHLKKSISAELQEKSHLQLELENLKRSHEEVVQKEYIASLEKHKLVSRLLDVSGIAADNHEDVNPEHADVVSILDKCLEKVREDSCPSEPSVVEFDKLEKFKSLLYLTDQEMSLYKLIVEEDTLVRGQLSNLTHDLEIKDQELDALKEEKSGLQRSLDQLEDRCALLKEKLSLAVKKGKGLVQDRETMKGSLNEKDAEIDRLNAELQQYLAKCTEFQDQVTKMTLDLESKALLETELVTVKEHADQLEHFIAERSSMLQKIMESIEGISTATSLTFEEPMEKINYIAGYINELEVSKMEMQQELSKVKDEASSLYNKLSEAETRLMTVEGALSAAETFKSQLLGEKEELEVSMAHLEEELEKVSAKASSHLSQIEELSASKRELEEALSVAEDNILKFMKESKIAEESRILTEEQLQKLKEEFQKQNEEAFSHVSKFEELSSNRRALEDALSQAENKVSRLMSERETAIESKILAEEQLQKLKDDYSGYVTKLADADKTIQSLEDALAQSRKNSSELAEEHSKAEIGRADLDSELKKLREEVDSYAIKLSDASLTINTLEGALKKAESNISDLVEEKKNAEQEILALSSKLKSCMEELAETHGSKENLSLELSGQLSRLHVTLKDDTLASSLGQCFERKFQNLSNMESLLSEMWEYIQKMDSNMEQNSPAIKDDASFSTLVSRPDTTMSLESDNDGSATDSENISSHIEKLNEGFHLKSKVLVNKCDSLSAHMDESIAFLSRRLHRMKDRILGIINETKDIKQQVKDIETYKQRQEDAVSLLDGDIRILLSACTDATQTLELNVQKRVMELRSSLESVKLDDILSSELGALEDVPALGLASDSAKIAEKLLLVAKQNQNLTEVFQAAINKLASIIEDMQEKMKESQVTCDEVKRERDQYKDTISKLEGDLKAHQDISDVMSAQLNGYREKEDKLRKREKELSTALSKVQEFEGSPLSASQVKLIVDKVNGVEFMDVDFPVQESHDSANVSKLFHVLETFSACQQKVQILSRDNEELQSVVDSQILEIESLKRQVEDHLDNKKDPKILNKLFEVESGLQNIVRKLGGSDLLKDIKGDEEIQLLPLLDKLVNTTMIEFDGLKLKNEELGSKLLGTQKVVDDLSNKIKFFEDSNQARVVPTEIGPDTGTSLSSQSEISEMQDVAALGKSNNMPPVPYAAHVRTLRKGSSDHLALNIDSDSERLIGNKESDEDKGHVFKSLNTSGLIPRQGRTVADRVDGIWVSGSRALMNHPRGRLGLIAYCIVVHIWLFGTVL
ncbi:trans-Golgi network-localized SYP41-interacting protein 1 isoform X2 [Andrographis paniculata]|uniref:trans-Golgi network-localized SYP41-interacting protein 1 isoform X2 n=1 Tax=Andrographis paniculata TaxID=175694 RepID=UPI0021E86217|nr:trans-Golgi network-localized SYP41-interacting protein 1 isoform X2 [Andrographis paniculata]